MASKQSRRASEMTPNQDETDCDLLTSETSLLNYTIKHLAESNAQLITQCKNDMMNSKEHLFTDDHVDHASAKTNDVISEKLHALDVQGELLQSAGEEISLIQHVLAYREILEIAILRMRLRYDRLKEERAWLHDELKYFETKSLQEKNKAKQLREKTAHFAFIYHQRRTWNDDGIPTEMCALPNERTDGNESYWQLGDKITHMRSQLTPLKRISMDFADSLSSTHENETIMDSDEIADSQGPGNQGQCFNDLTEYGDVIRNDENLMTEINCNASNSGKMTLSELRELMLGDNAKDSKKTADISGSSRRFRSTLGRERNNKHAKEFLEDLQLSDLEKETLKQCMKTMDTQAPHTMQPKLEPDVTLEQVVEQFIRSSHRTQNLATFVDLIRQFNHKEMRSPGIGLCWLAINSLKRYEKQLRPSEKLARRASVGNIKRIRRGVLGMFEPGTWEEVEYRNVLDDLCRLLSILSHLYRTRNELSKAAECLKDLLRMRRATHTWKQVSVAQALSNLAWIQSTLKECNPALANARKSLQLRRELISEDSPVVDQSTTELSVAKQATSLALMLMYKQQTEQKKLRYHRFPFRDISEIPTLLNEAIRIESNLLEYAENSGIPISIDRSPSITDYPGSIVGDSYGRESKKQINPIEESLLVTRSALSVYFVCGKKWNKAQKQLSQNLVQLDSIHPDDDTDRPSATMKMLKLICLKCLLHVYRITHQNGDMDIIFERVSKLDPFYRLTDEINEEELIRFCQSCLFKHAQ